MIRKNSAASVTECSSSAAGILQSRVDVGKSNLKTSFDATQKALDAVSALSGVGPATASLVLAVYSPEDIPFFEDEVFQWLCSDTWLQKGGKLKYDKKEYEQLFRQLWELRERLGLEIVQAVDIEKASFVMMRDKQAVNPPVSSTEKKSASNPKTKQSKTVKDEYKRSAAYPEVDTGKIDEEEASMRRSKRVKR